MRATIAIAMAAAMAANASAFMAGPTPLGSMMRGRSLQLRSAETARSAEARGPTMALALVTGASRGIGKSIALELGKSLLTHVPPRGSNVIVNYAGSQQAAEGVVKELEGMGVKAMAVKADTSDPAQVDAMFKAIAESFDEPVRTR
ncbi:hypothetical protein GUITHDRAFT_106636 [Guillardia theta CCMP2712]|uniref:3-oxoacyl-[acyl-carrier-protein] reductase n=1 Tax=Guillardia theta (strain CCMP2712) TaxID=905079 RepID=L1JGJ8_GUITC|nr:hypothetical protein GUITHDRAFT_106636 [Guillardia theta CCMP2712]EKX47648.1 hypothetical protein GUITHDRAFT_106636 [Guillardia theta CCMP2712]|eukprot:XP_005834628.1 hypothetical protein GUITHDRAFT_106636 [Guillardia theta CCMP2712]